ncbi:3-phosphoshikimate 1-carboxyvinyltransferase [Canibacter zhoujuaniae]|uniref:3-phosphoshikimate 1-carboxyvinyltransferase n=1 Tax=Canibacter zhoujuaniae TaxID=2708343 RepID=UPI00141FB172|nr:3-phosphoshikimate 1-carboxyvinyltransferase [Canibacter zhoujuaniae]
MFVARNNAQSVTAERVVPWAAPTPIDPINAFVPLPGSKSLTNRELVLAALANDTSTIVAPLRSRDTNLMINGLTTLGTVFESETVGEIEQLRVTPAQELTGSGTIDCGLAGTVMRFLPAVAALALGPTGFDGDPYARKRPMGPVLDALRQVGVDISDDGRGALPFTVHGFGSVSGGRVSLDASLSSQFVSGLLLAAARFENGVHVIHTGEHLPSIPHIEMTLETLTARGVKAYSPEAGVWVAEPGPIAARTVTIEPDLSNAAPFLAAALVTGGSVTVPLWPHTTTQVGDQLRSLLTHFGATVTKTEDKLTVTGQPDGKINGVQLHIPEAGELAPALVGLAALADEPSRITGIGHIRHHETDRIAALVSEINNLGGDARELPDGIEVRPAQLHGGLWRAYADHRMATTGALIGLRVPGVEIDDIACTSKTMPDFIGMWARALGCE